VNALQKLMQGKFQNASKISLQWILQMKLNSKTFHISKRQSARNSYIFFQYSFGFRWRILKMKKFPMPDNLENSLMKESRTSERGIFVLRNLISRDWKPTSSYCFF